MYLIVVQTPARVALAVLPGHALDALAEVIGALEVNPWTVGRPWDESNPDGNVRIVTFAGDGMVTYMVLERDREVHVIEVRAG